MRKAFLLALAGSSITAIVAASPAFAQNTQQQSPPPTPTPSAQAPAEDDDEIIITGTQIRGIAPVGSNVIGITSDQIKTTGVTDANQLLGQLPQSSFFMALPEPGGGVIGAGTARVPISRPNLRNLPAAGSGSGALTLVLMDGHRIVPSGIEQSAVDAGIVPPSLLERFEAILDGASAVYGSDAAGGVINYITRKRYDGAEINARYGIADDYWQAQISATVGTTWKSGGASISYEFSKNSNLLLGDRDYNSPINWINPLSPVTGVAVAGGPPAVDDLTCDTPNVQDVTGAALNATKTFHVSGAGFAPNPQFCAANEFSTQTPSQRRHSVFAVVSQDITDSITFDVTGFYSNRLQTQNSGPVRGNVLIRPNNPNYRCDLTITTSCALSQVAGNNASTQRVHFSYGPARGNDQGFNDTRVETWQITPTFTVDLGSDWQVRASAAYGESKTSVTQNATDATFLARAVSGNTAGAPPFPTVADPTVGGWLNPYNIAATPTSVLDKIFWTNYTEGVHKMTDFRVIADGPLFTLPGGDVRVGVGAEYNKTTLRVHKLDSTGGSAHAFLDPIKAGVTAKSVFGEVVVPVFGPDNAVPGLHSLTLSASGRYDSYGDGIDTFNPRFAFTFEPAEWLTFRGSWGKSFRAPNPADRVGVTNGSIRCIGGNGGLAGCGNAVMQIPFYLDQVALTVLDTDENTAGIQTAPCYSTTVTACNPGPRGANAGASNAVYIGLIGGTDPNLVPETSKNWSIGADFRPPQVPGLTFSATLWNIAWKDFISLPQPAISLASLFRFLPQNYTVCRTSTNAGTFPYAANLCAPGGPLDAALQAFVAQTNNGPTVLQEVRNNGHDIIYFVNTLTTNLANFKVRGADASVRYRTDTSFGSVDASVNGAWLINSDLQFAAGAPFDDQLASGESTFRMTASVGADIGDFRAQVTWRHIDGYLDSFNLGLGGTERLLAQQKIPQSNVFDLVFRYDFNGDDFFTRDLQLQLVINNVFNEEPVQSLTAAGGRIGTINTIGRLFEFGISKKF